MTTGQPNHLSARAKHFFNDWTTANARAVSPPPVTRREASTPRPARRRALAVASALLLSAGVAVVMPGSSAQADPSATTWYRLRMCESSNNYRINTGNAHYGAYQFDLSTWQSVGGHGYPYLASPAEQNARALILYRERGWQPWQCASILGLREDSDAGSGYIADIHVPTSGGSSSGGSSSGGSSSGIPAFPGGSRWYRYGDWSRNIKTFQDHMHARGYFPVGTGQYGPLTLRMVKRLQQLNGLIPNGYIGPNTWRLAWTGRFSTSATVSPVAPAFPGGSHWYSYGENNSNIKVLQDHMHARGYFPVGTGQYGPITYRMVTQLQRLNGLVPNGLIGPNTWRLAWTGTYRAP